MNSDATAILTPEEMYRADALATSHYKIPSLRLMENAGKAVTSVVMKRFPKGPVLILCGPGNNGGDGFVVARLLTAKKRKVQVLTWADRKALKGDAATMAAKFKGMTGSMPDLDMAIQAKVRPVLVIDALFGAGLSKSFPESVARTVNSSGIPVLAIDVPSGLDGLTGQVRGASLKADVTVTFFRKKPAHVLEPGRSLCGDLVVADIGIPDVVEAELNVRLGENGPPMLPALAADTHKYKRGHALVWSGGELNTGAARLAAVAAARVGSGLTTIVGNHEALRIHASHLTSIMLYPVESSDDLRTLLEDKRITAICIGPAAGVTEKTRKAVKRILASSFPAVLDADALTSFVDEPNTLFQAIKAGPGRAVVLTPHEGEFSRLFSGISVNIKDKVERAREAARMSGAHVVLKGPDTVIASPAGEARVNSNALPKLATAGSGDVLAGIITGLLAQGMDGFDAACGGVWLHGDAARRCGRRTPIAEDIVAERGR